MRTVLPLLFLMAATAVLPAQEAGVAAPAAPAPVLRTARLAWFRGDLQVQRADNTAPTPTADNPNPDSAALNMPILAGSRLVTGSDAQAEVEFEDGSVARLTPNTALSVDTLSVDGKTAGTQLSLLSGLAYFELRHAPKAEYTVSAGTMLIAPADNAIFRIALDQPPVTVSVVSGTLTVSAEADPDASQAGFTATVKAGESLHADPEDATRYFLNPQLATSSWDSWNQSRDAAAGAEAATRTSARDSYAGTQGYGWSDLDANGTWYTVTNADGTVSEVWQPAIAADPAAEAGVVETSAATTDDSSDADAFDPYGDGAFVYSGDGYVWASGYSWGWLPYRCGHWNYYPQFGWAWTPDRFCRVYGFGGAGGINVGRRPRRYHVIRFPPVTPVHPILRVHTADPRPRQPRKEDKPVPVKLAGVIATPLLPLPLPAIAAEGFSGGALARDFSVEPLTRQPVLGSVASPVMEPAPATGWIVGAPAAQTLESNRSNRVPPSTSIQRPAVPARASAPPPAATPRAAPAAAPAAANKPK